MKKTISLLIVPIVVLSIVSGLLFNQLVAVQNENSELRNELFDTNAKLEEYHNTNLQFESQINELEYQLSNATNRVKITDFVVNGTTTAPVLYGLASDFFVTVENFGINDVENLTVVYSFRFSADSNKLFNQSISIGTVKEGESKTVHRWDLHGYARTFVVQLMMNDVVLDER